MQISRQIGFGIAILLSLACSYASAQKTLSILRASGSMLSMRIDTVFYPNRWNIDPKLKPDVSQIPVPVGKTVRVAFIAAKDSLVRTIRVGDVLNFVVLTPGGDSAFTQIRGIAFTEPAVFSRQYVQTHTGKTFVEIPDVYELINIVFALTDAGKKSADLIQKDTPYYKSVLANFNQYGSDRIVSVVDSLLKQDESQYFFLKMDAYAYSLDSQGIIRQSPVYDRVSWGTANTLRPYLPLLQQFAKHSNFARFYEQQRPFYDRLITSYRDSLSVADMQAWLNRNFPGTKYQSFKIIFSPLVSANQSAQWFANNGFKEAQAHVNYPFDTGKDSAVSATATNLRRGNIVFTELNHAFINPEADKYAKELASSIRNLDDWLARDKPARRWYNNVYACFNEYMNWGLVSLRYADAAPTGDLPLLQKRVEERMVTYRGFKKFAEFNQFLVAAYKSRRAGTTVADLYPQIIHWFASQTEKK